MLRRWLLLLLLLSAPLQADDGFRVLVSIKPVHSILAGLMQGVETPELLIGDGQTPYDFQPSIMQLDALRQADLVVWVGPEMEASLAGPIGKLPASVRVVELLSSPTLKILPQRGGEGRDPYFWLDSRNALLLLDELTGLLQEMDPKRTHVYARNRFEYLARLSRLDREYEYGYRGLRGGLAVQYFDTLQYFEQAYAMKVLERAAPSPRHAVDTAALLKVRQRLVDGEAACLLVEEGLPADNLDLARPDGKGNLGTLASLGGRWPAGPDLYFELMRYNSDTIKRCLNAELPAEVQVSEDDPLPGQEMGGGRFLLTDHLGGLVSPESMRGKYQMLYFGYTYCPDICPTSLQVLSLALNRLGDKADLIQPYFVTIDPERDTVGVMRDYVSYFDNRMIGVTGSPEMVSRMAAQYRVRYEKVEEPGKDPSMYLMDHSASLYLLGPDGRFLKKFLHGITADQLTTELVHILP